METRVYDRAGRLTEVKNQKGANVLSHFVSTLDPAGNPTQVVRTGSLSETQTYTYDASDRLTGVCFQAGTCPGALDPFIRWTYDRVGNRLTEERPAPVGTTSYTYDARDRLLSAGLTSYTYDANGNQLSAGLRTFTYDLADRLQTTTLGATTTTYSYDGEGKRLQASTGSSNSAKTNFLWDVAFGLPQLARENNGGGSLQRRYLYGERRIARISGSSFFYYHYDPLGSAAHLTAANGATRWTYAYEPFGSLRLETPSGNAPLNFLKFTGEYLDPTGLYHLRARQYEPSTGRFVGVDPVRSAADHVATSTYSYVRNRSTTMVDPSGRILEPSLRGIRSTEEVVSRVNILRLIDPARLSEPPDRRCAAEYAWLRYVVGGQFQWEIDVLMDWCWNSAGSLTKVKWKKIPRFASLAPICQIFLGLQIQCAEHAWTYNPFERGWKVESESGGRGYARYGLRLRAHLVEMVEVIGVQDYPFIQVSGCKPIARFQVEAQGRTVSKRLTPNCYAV